MLCHAPGNDPLLADTEGESRGYVQSLRMEGTNLSEFSEDFQNFGGSYLSEFPNEGGSNLSEFWTFKLIKNAHLYFKKS